MLGRLMDPRGPPKGPPKGPLRGLLGGPPTKPANRTCTKMSKLVADHLTFEKEEVLV